MGRYCRLLHVSRSVLIAYIRTQEGWLYLCVMIVLFHRGVVALQTSERINRHLVCDELNYTMSKQGYPEGAMELIMLLKNSPI